MTTWTNPMIGNHDGTGQKYGDPRDGGARTHRGYDIGTAGVTGRPVVAGGSGTVRIAGYANVRGNHVLIDHGNGYRTLYQHLASMSVGVGQTVATGQQIGICGGTGGSYPIHLHLQVFARGTGTSLKDEADTIDPKPFFRDRGVTLGVTTPATPTTPTTPDTKDWFDMASLDDLRSLLGTELASVVQQVNAHTTSSSTAPSTDSLRTAVRAELAATMPDLLHSARSVVIADVTDAGTVIVDLGARTYQPIGPARLALAQALGLDYIRSQGATFLSGFTKIPG